MSETARHAEIARRHARKRDRDRQPFSVAAVRPNEIQRLLVSRYGHELPDDDAGRDDAFVMVNALAWRPQAERRIPAWLSLRTPWMRQDEARALTARTIAKPIKWSADKLGRRLNLTEAERQRLRITTIGAVDVDKAERQTRRKERKRLREQARRRAAGAKSRAEYETQSISKAKPWETIGMSRASWYRRQRQTRETSPCPA
jgi:hypothetical protein